MPSRNHRHAHFSEVETHTALLSPELRCLDSITRGSTASEHKSGQASPARDSLDSTSPRASAPVGFRVLHLVVLVGFIGCVGFLGHRWLFPPLQIRAYAEVPHVSVTSPRCGRVEMRLQVGQFIEKGDLLAVVRISEIEEEWRGMEMDRLRSELGAVADRRTKVIRRLADQQRVREQRIHTEQDVALAGVLYAAIRDDAETDFSHGEALARQATGLACSLRSRAESLLADGRAAWVEREEAELREVSRSLIIDALVRASDRSARLAGVTKSLEQAITRSVSAVGGAPTPEELQDMRLVGEIDRDLSIKQAALARLSSLDHEYLVVAPSAGTVVSITRRTLHNIGDLIAEISVPTDGLISLLIPYDGFERFVERGAEIPFRVKRTGYQGSMTIRVTRRGFTERDRRLNRVEFIEHLAIPTQPIPDLVPGEIIEVLR